MADIAQGTTCPQCGTFNAVGGSEADEYFAGKCGCCGGPVAVKNAKYDPGVAKVVAAKDAEIAALKAQIAESQPAAAPNVTVPDHGASALPGFDESGEATEDVDG